MRSSMRRRKRTDPAVGAMGFWGGFDASSAPVCGEAILNGACFSREVHRLGVPLHRRKLDLDVIYELDVILI